MKKIAFSVILLLFASLFLSAENKQNLQEDQEAIQYEVVVTANRVETSKKEVAASITVITREQLEETKRTTVMEALEDVLSLTVIRNGPPGSASSVFIRGANSEHTLVMIDGIEMNDPSTPTRSFDLSLLLVENVDRIEIIRGPQSTLYGSDAMGGVINIISKQTTGKPEFHLSGLGGSYGSYSGNAEVSGSSAALRYSLAATLHDTEGYSAASTAYQGNSEADGHRNLCFSGRLGMDLTQHISLDLSLRRIATKTDIDNFGGDYGDDPNNVQEYDAFLFVGQARGLFLRNRWEQKLRVALVDYDRAQDNPVDEIDPYSSEVSRYKSKLQKIDWQNNFYINNSNTLTIGVDFQQEQAESLYRSESMLGPYESSFPLQKAHNIGIFLQDQFKVAGRFFLTAGLRYDDHSQAESEFTYRIAPVYIIGETDTRIKATIGTGFKAPSLYQLYAPGTVYGSVGNMDLKPEKSIGWDIGIEQSFLQNRLMFGLAYFSTLFENLIDFDYLQGYINIKIASTKGVEVLLESRPTDTLHFLATYTRLEAQDKDADEYLLRRPKDKFSASFNWKFSERANINLSLIHVGQREDLFWIGWTPARVTMDSFTLLNAAGSYNLIEYLQLFLRIDNFLDSKYETVKGYGTAGFSVYGGLKVTF
ncbi:MAG: TonB-dependent receptor [Candidatus Aminicenantes bacterium]|nr:TonB-dependent receptor [Candidatus Aminicenantes bacterium]